MAWEREWLLFRISTTEVWMSMDFLDHPCPPKIGSYDDGIYLMKHRWMTAGVWIQRFKLWWPSRGEPCPSAIAAENCGVTGKCTDILGGRCSNQNKGHPSPKLFIGTFLIQGKGAGAWAPLGVYLCTCLSDEVIIEERNSVPRGHKKLSQAHFIFPHIFCVDRDDWEDFESRVMPRNSMEVLRPEVFSLERSTQSSE